jgi:hypothetical protein
MGSENNMEVFMKKITHLSGIVFMVLWAVVFLTAANAAPYTYKGNKPIYPAVYQAVMNGNKANWRDSKAAVPDPNTVVIEHVRVSDLLMLADFTLKISLENNVVTYQFSNIRERLPTGKDSDWSSVDKFVQKDREQIFTSYFDKEIPKIMENDALYAKAKEAADKSLGGPPGGGDLNYSLALQNPQKYLIYPAVGAAFNSVKESLGAKTANLYDISCLDNEFVIKDCFGVRGSLDYIEYQIKIAYKEGQLTVNFTDVKKVDARMLMIYQDIDIGKMSRFDTQKIVDQLKTQTEKSLATADAYRAAKKAFFENNFFLSRVLYSLTDFSTDEFVEKILKGEELSFSASVFDVKKNDKPEFKNFTAVINATLPVEGSRSTFDPHVTLYTSDSSLTRLKTGEKVTLSGKFVRLEKNMATYYFIITK